MALLVKSVQQVDFSRLFFGSHLTTGRHKVASVGRTLSLPAQHGKKSTAKSPATAGCSAERVGRGLGQAG